MHNYYIINGFIEFHPAASTLRNLNDPEKVVVLNSPAGRCLLLLINRNDTIVTQQEFMEIVWEKNGMMVSPNTFYQNISILRKGLRKAGLIEDPVVTIPRVGLTLASGTEIIKRSSVEPEPDSSRNSLSDEKRSSEAALREEKGPLHSPEAEKVDTPPEQPLSARRENRPQSEIALHRNASGMLLWTVGLLIAILLTVTVNFYRSSDNNRHYFSKYFFLANIHGCHVFFSNKNATPDARIRMRSLAENLKTSCSHYPWMYITYYYMLPRISVIRCNKQMDEPNICISEYYFRGLEQSD